MEELRRLLVQRQSQLLQEIEKIGDLISMLDAPPASSANTLSSWRWKDFEELVHKLSTTETDTFRTDAEHPAAPSQFSGISRHSNLEKKPTRPKVSNNPKPAAVVDMVKQILSINGKPMTRTELLAELVERDIVIDGYNPSKVLGTTLWRARNSLVSIKNFGYWFSDRPYARAGYYPSGHTEETYE
jgi:hypothetical protein